MARRVLGIALGLPLILLYGVSVCRQWAGERYRAEFERLQKAEPLDSMSRPAPEIVAKRRSLLLRAARFLPNDPEISYRRALVALVSAETESMLPSSESADASGGIAPSARELLLESLKEIDQAIRFDPATAEYPFVKATILQNLTDSAPGLEAGVVERAVAHQLAIAESLDPFSPPLQFRMGSFWLALGEKEKARKSFTIALHDSVQFAGSVFGLLWSTVERPEELIGYVGNEPLAQALLMNFLNSHGDRSGAEALFEKLERGLPSDLRIVEEMYAYAVWAGKYGRMHDLLSRLLARKGQWSEFQTSRLRYFLGRLYLIQGEYAEALKELENSLALDSSYVPCHIDLAKAYLGSHQPEKAAARLRYVLSALGNEPSTGRHLAEIHYGLGQANEAAGNLEAALSEYLKASNEDPTNRRFAEKVIETSGRR